VEGERLERAAQIVAGATRAVFGTMLGLDPRPQTAYCNPEPLGASEVTAMIGLAGGQVGSVSIHCTREQGAAFTSSLVGGEPGSGESDEQVRDALGEIINMIAGNVKTALAQSQGAQVEISLPTVILSQRSSVRVQAQSSAVVPFECARGNFSVELVLTAVR
jgi:chemotaxis protein CheX